MMKSGVRILAIDDSPFTRKDKKSLLVGVVGRADVIEGVLSFNVAVDGTDSTQKIIKAAESSRFRDQVRVLALNGNTVAGMNVIDIVGLSKKLKMPVLAITRKKPHASMLKKSLRLAKPSGYSDKIRVLDATASSAELVKADGMYIQVTGARPNEIIKYVGQCIRLLRLAHIIASGIARGESQGRL